MAPLKPCSSSVAPLLTWNAELADSAVFDWAMTVPETMFVAPL